MRKKSPCFVKVYLQRRFVIYEKTAMIEIEEILSSVGMSETDINYLLARFLEEEVKCYVDCMESVGVNLEPSEYFA